MAVGDAYCDAATYRAIVSKSDSSEDAEILADLKAVSRYIDRMCGRFFTQDAAAVARVYAVPASPAPYRDPFFNTPWSGSYATPLAVDDVASTAGLVVKVDADGDGLFTDDPAWASTDYVLEPVNAATGPEPAPYTRIAVPAWSSRGAFTAGQRVEVTAVWGWPAVPDAIVRACAHLTGILRFESPRATSRVNEVGEVVSASREAQSIVRDLVKAYRRTAVVIA